MQALQNKYKMAQELQKILISYEKNDFPDSKEYLKALLQLIEKLTNTKLLKEYELSRVLDTYLRYITSYIFDFFNHETTVEEIASIRKLNHSLTTHMLQIIEYYMQNIDKKQAKGYK